MSALKVRYNDIESWKTAVKQWLVDLKALGPNYGWFASNGELSSFITELDRRDLQNTSAFDGIRLIIEFYKLVQVSDRSAKMPPEIKDLWVRIQPLFKSGTRLGKTMMNKASGPNFARTGAPISNSYKNNANAYNARMQPQTPPARVQYNNGLRWSWSGHEWQDGGVRRIGTRTSNVLYRS